VSDQPRRGDVARTAIRGIRKYQEMVVERDALRELVRRASTDSCVTTSDEPGCFFCDRVDHTPDCPAGRLLSRAECQEGDDGR